MMSEQNSINPVAILREIEERCRGCDTGLPHKAEASDEWSGIAFRLGSNKLVAPMDDIVEILDYPELSTVPLTQPWVRGVANIRGNLLPVIDLNGFLVNEPPRLTGKTRVLVVDFDGVYSGLVVDEVLGLKYFREDELSSDDPGVGEELRPYMRGGFRRGERVWGVFSLFALVESPQFMQAAV